MLPVDGTILFPELQEIYRIWYKEVSTTKPSAAACYSFIPIDDDPDHHLQSVSQSYKVSRSIRAGNSSTKHWPQDYRRDG